MLEPSEKATGVPPEGVKVIPVMGTLKERIEVFAGGVSRIVRLSEALLGGGVPPPGGRPLQEVSVNATRQITLREAEFRLIGYSTLQIWCLPRPTPLARGFQS